MAFGVQVMLVKAVDLPSADLNGKSDPYVVFKLGDTTRKSSHVAANVNPEWTPAETFDFFAEDPHFAVLDVQVFDHDRFSKDDLIGSTSIAVSQFVDSSKSGVRMYELVVPNIFDRQGRKSAIMLEITVAKIE